MATADQPGAATQVQPPAQLLTHGDARVAQQRRTKHAGHAVAERQQVRFEPVSVAVEHGAQVPWPALPGAPGTTPAADTRWRT